MVYQKPELPFDKAAREQDIYLNLLFDILTGNLDFHEGNTDYASHNYHSFPAKFPPQLPKIFIENLTKPGDIVLDPMVGSGTTVLEAYLADRKSLGFDIDPLAIRISRVKTTPLSTEEVIGVGKQIVISARQMLLSSRELLIEQFASRLDEPTRHFLNQWFLPDTQLELFALIEQIENLQQVELRTFFEVCFSAIIITKSGGISLALDLGHTRPHLAKKVTDRFGNLLFGESTDVAKYHTKLLRPVFPEFERRIKQNIMGILLKANSVCSPKIEFGNAQNLPIQDDSIDLIVTSPPYASNAIDYMRAHKFSLAWLGYSIDQLGKKRKEYIGGESVTNFVFQGLAPLPAETVNRLQEIDEKKALVLHRYYTEMTQVINEMYRVLKPGKASIVVVGNSVMRGIDTQTAQCLADIGKSIGFQVPHIGIRHLDRDKRMLPAGGVVNRNSQIQQRMHEEYVIGFYKPL